MDSAPRQSAALRRPRRCSSRPPPPPSPPTLALLALLVSCAPTRAYYSDSPALLAAGAPPWLTSADQRRHVESLTSRCFTSTVVENPDQIAPQFVVVRAGQETRLDASAPPEAIRRSANFDPTKHTTILVHGFSQSYPDTEWLRRVRALYELYPPRLEQENLIIMDWGRASKGNYQQVAARANAMGAFLANFMAKLVYDLGADRMDLHVIGHSLGAHVAGFAGKRMRPRIGRITALDPAGPCFGKFVSSPEQARLSRDDAFEVDVYHYDNNFLGLSQQIGHFDVLVNGGSAQPGCKDNLNTIIQAAITVAFNRNRVLSESHTRSTEVAAADLAHLPDSNATAVAQANTATADDSMSTVRRPLRLAPDRAAECHEVAYECRDYSAFMAGECGQCDRYNSQCFFMGFHFQYKHMQPRPLRAAQQADRQRLFYISTSSAGNFCLYHYQILVKFEPLPGATLKGADMSRHSPMKWRLELALANERREWISVTMRNQMAPHTFTYLLRTEWEPASFHLGQLQVRQLSDGSLISLMGGGQLRKQPYRVSYVKVNYMSNADLELRERFSSTLCPQPSGRQDLASNEISGQEADWIPLGECEDPRSMAPPPPPLLLLKGRRQ